VNDDSGTAISDGVSATDDRSKVAVTSTGVDNDAAHGIPQYLRGYGDNDLLAMNLSGKKSAALPFPVIVWVRDIGMTQT